MPIKSDLNDHPSFHDVHTFVGNSTTLHKIAHETHLLYNWREGYIGLFLFGHEILRWYSDGYIAFTFAGYNTLTTKRRLNQYLPEYVTVYSKEFTPYVHIGINWDNRADDKEVDPNRWVVLTPYGSLLPDDMVGCFIDEYGEEPWWLVYLYANSAWADITLVVDEVWHDLWNLTSERREYFNLPGTDVQYIDVYEDDQGFAYGELLSEDEYNAICGNS